MMKNKRFLLSHVFWFIKEMNILRHAVFGYYFLKDLGIRYVEKKIIHNFFVIPQSL